VAKACERLRIELRLEQLQQQLRSLLTVLQQDAEQLGVLKIVVSRSGAARGCYLPQDADSTLVLSYRTLPSDTFRDTKIALVKSSHPLPHSALLGGIKHISRLEYIAAELALPAPLSLGQELLLLDSVGNIVETMHHNIFFRKGKALYTPNVDTCGVRGVMREWTILEAEQLGLPVVQCDCDISFLQDAEEVFLTNAVQGVVCVAKYGEFNYENFGFAEALIKALELKYKFYES